MFLMAAPHEHVELAGTAIEQDKRCGVTRAKRGAFRDIVALDTLQFRSRHAFHSASLTMLAFMAYLEEAQLAACYTIIDRRMLFPARRPDRRSHACAWPIEDRRPTP